MKIIDAYCGVGPWATRNSMTPCQPAEILDVMDACGIDDALIFDNTIAFHAWAPDVNSLTIKTVATTVSGRFIPSFVISPRPYQESLNADDFTQEMKKAQAKAAWMWPSSQAHGMSTWIIGDLLSMCSDKKIPLFLPSDQLTPDQIYAIAHEFPKLRLILANLTFRSDNWLYPLLKKHGEIRVCLGFSYNPPLGPEQFVRHFGAERMIFGSGLPFYAPGGLIAHVMYSRLHDADKQMIFSGNIERLMTEVCL